MSIRKHQQSIYSALAVLILLLYGTCFSLTQAGSVFVCGNLPLSANRFLTLHDTSLSREIATPDVPNQRVTSNSGQQLQRNRQRTFIKFASVLLTIGSIAPNPMLFFRMLTHGLHHEALSNIIIVRYIHTKDGRK